MFEHLLENSIDLEKWQAHYEQTLIVGNLATDLAQHENGHLDKEIKKHFLPSNEPLTPAVLGLFKTNYLKKLGIACFKIVEKGQGIIHLVLPNSILSQPLFRRIRQYFLENFEQIYVLDLHGATETDERTPSGEIDENMLNVGFGVSLLILVKKEGANNFIKQSDLYGTKEQKQYFFKANTLQSIAWKSLQPQSPYFIFKDKTSKEEYLKGFPIGELFKQTEEGVKSIKTFFKKDDPTKNYLPIWIAPFDRRWIETEQTRDFNAGNTSLCLVKKSKHNPQGCFIANSLVERKLLGDVTAVFPLYIFRKSEGLFGGENSKMQVPNFSSAFKNYINSLYKEKLSPELILGYIYATLWDKNYQSQFGHFLKEDYPYIPFPANVNSFKQQAIQGKALYQAHTFEKIPAGDVGDIHHRLKTKQNLHFETLRIRPDADNEEFITIFLNKDLHIRQVPKAVWNFQMGTQPVLETYLKSRWGISLTHDQLQEISDLVKVLDFSVSTETNQP